MFVTVCWMTQSFLCSSNNGLHCILTCICQIPSDGSCPVVVLNSCMFPDPVELNSWYLLLLQRSRNCKDGLDSTHPVKSVAVKVILQLHFKGILIQLLTALKVWQRNAKWLIGDFSTTRRCSPWSAEGKCKAFFLLGPGAQPQCGIFWVVLITDVCSPV